jgi:hypothetical protein
MGFAVLFPIPISFQLLVVVCARDGRGCSFLRLFAPGMGSCSSPMDTFLIMVFFPDTASLSVKGNQELEGTPDGYY